MINHWNWGPPVLHKHINQQENWEYDSGTSQQQTYTKKHSLFNDSIFEMCWVSLPQAFGGLGIKLGFACHLCMTSGCPWHQLLKRLNFWSNHAESKKRASDLWEKVLFLGSPLKMFGTWQQRRPQRMIPLRANCTASAPDNASTSRMTCPTNLQSVWIKTLPAIHQHQRSWCSGKIFIHKYLYLYIYIYCIVTDFDRQHLRWFLNLASGCRLHLQPGTPRLLVGKTPSGAKRSHVKWWFGQVNCWRNHELEGQIYWVKCSKHIDETWNILTSGRCSVFSARSLSVHWSGS